MSEAEAAAALAARTDQKLVSQGEPAGELKVALEKGEKTVNHGSPVAAFAASPDGKRVVSVGADGSVKLWDVETGKQIAELKGDIRATLNLGLDIRIPTSYIADEAQRLRSYKRIADVKDEDQAKRVTDELADRYGPIPDEVSNLVRFSLLKSLAERAGVDSIDRRQGFANIKLHQQSKVDPVKLTASVRSTPGAQFTPAGVLKLPLTVSKSPAELLEQLRFILVELTAEEPVGAKK